MKKTTVHPMPTAQETLDMLLNRTNAESLKESLKEMFNTYLKSESSNDQMSRERVMRHYDALDGLLETLIMVSHFNRTNY
ncbi:hypothetical protein [Ulvibacterium sp.]|uniref:hypothetical protein n=1 Tax=Ulvibacterium sp. TaxID=2665914 RepID=UPI00262BFE75|nr:hypothetical protein [Ulvibacterium sp.]